MSVAMTAKTGETAGQNLSELTLWSQRPTAQVLEQLGSDPENGLSPQEAARRLEQYGPNQLEEAPPRTLWQKLFDQLKEVLVLILLGAALISGLLGEWVDAAAILLIVIVNAVLGVTQESRAEEALAALKRMSAPKARVLRGGQFVEIPAAEVVPGDIIRLETGDLVPADARIIQAANLRVDESALTGESVPVEKHAGELPPEAGNSLGDMHNLVFASTTVSYGRGLAVAYATGMNTAIGRIAGMLQGGEAEETPLQRRMAELGRTLGVLAGILVAIVFVAGLLRDEPVLEMFLTAISLAVAAIPEGLPAVVTIVLALGVQRMARRRAIIRRLPAVETLGTATVIASDKTGTLTKNEMTVVRIFSGGRLYTVTGEGYEPRGEIQLDGKAVVPQHEPGLTALLAAMSLCNDARLEERPKEEGGRRVIGDPTEGALLVAAEKAGLDLKLLNRVYPRIAEIPFESSRKRMTTFHKVASAAGGRTEIPGELLLAWPWERGASGSAAAAAGAGTADGVACAPGEAGGASAEGGRQVGACEVAFTKGAPEEVLFRCTHIFKDGEVYPLSSEERQQILGVAASLAEQAFRVLAVAYRIWDLRPQELRAEEVEAEMVFLGFVAEIDPPRPEVKEAVAAAHRAGIRPVMITGDHKATAVAIARELGIWEEGSQALTGAELEQMDDARLIEVSPRVRVYARVAPEHKLRIVRALQAHRHVVAVTGDGVNDAPALKGADIGVAMGITGTDVAKGAADMVLADDNFATIVSAIREGRVIYANIRKVVHYLLSCNIGEIVAIFLGIVLGWGRVLTPIQILWVNLVTDGLPALALGVEPPEKGVMNERPRDPKEGIFSRGLGWHIAWQGVLIGLVTLAVYRWEMLTRGDIVRAETVAFMTLALVQLLHSFNTRSLTQSIFTLGWFKNRALLVAVAASLVLQFAVLTIPVLRPVFDVTPLSWQDWGFVSLAALAVLTVVELVKAVSRMIAGRRQTHPAGK
ncbi:MAG: cation-translocating P-type ATPase [Limnochordales bacterium]|nr:cation-translocating P-type ATPase [Limnochordales bacterium]